MKRTRPLISLIATVVVGAGVISPAEAAVTYEAPESSDLGSVGQWSAPFSEGGVFDESPPETREESKMFPTAASIAMSPDGTIIYWNGTEGYEDSFVSVGWDVPEPRNRIRILDLRSYLRGQAPRPTWWTPSQETGIGADLFCSDLRNLPDGRLFAVGGLKYTNEDESLGFPGGRGRTEISGVDDARIYDPKSRSWVMAQPMHHKRWYPSLISLADGKLLVAGGVEDLVYNTKGTYVNETETFDPSTGEWTENGAAGTTALPFYSRLHLLPNGKVLYPAAGQMWAPWGQTADMTEWNKQKVYDPVARSWSDAGVAPFGARSGAFSVMLPLRPPYDKAELLIGGGTLAPAAPGSYVAHNLTEFVTAEGNSIERKVGPALNHARWFSTGIVLPSGEVIALNGGDRDEVLFPGITRGVRQAEMFDGEKWVPLASAGRDRLYHSTAILLGDGSILVGGHSPIGFTPFLFTPDNYTQGAFGSTLKDPSFEIFKPPYLFRGERPRLTQVQSGITNGDNFKITTPDASKITSVVLSRLPSVTHLADVDQRTIELEFAQTSNGSLEAHVPSNRAVALPGHYYLFLMTDNGQGPTPSRAAVVQIGETDMRAADMPFGI